MRVKSIGSNMTEITVGDWTVLVSYETPVAAYTPKQGYFRTSEFHSRTTSKHINRWLESLKAKELNQNFFDNLITVGV